LAACITNAFKLKLFTAAVAHKQQQVWPTHQVLWQLFL